MILGIDIGGTNIKFGVVNDDYQVIKKYSIPTNVEQGDKRIAADMIEKCKEIYEEYPFENIGIGTPGVVDSENGICVRAANLPYQNTPIAAMLKEALGVPVSVANDATCAVCGELYAGLGKQYRNLIMITLGTGVGGGIIIDGKPYFGKGGAAGEFGHMSIKYDGLPCPCGQVGCFEQYASVTALIRQTKEAVEQYPDSILARLAQDGINGKTVFDAAMEGCNIAAQVVDQYIGYLAKGLRSLIYIFAPEAVVIGGAISNQEDKLLIPLKEKLNASNIYISELKNDAGIIGAAGALQPFL